MRAEEHFSGAQTASEAALLESLSPCLDAAGVRASRVALLPGGRINESYLLLGDGEALVLRLSPPSRRARQVEFEFGVLRALHAGGAHVARPLCGTSVALGGQARQMLLSTYLPGQSLGSTEAYQLPAEELSGLLTPVRRLLDALKPPFRPVAETRVFEARLPALFQQLGPERVASFKREFSELQGWERGEARSLPTSVVHSDIYGANVLRTPDALALIDFDDAHVAVRAQDWVGPAIDFSFAPRSAGQLPSFDEERYQQMLERLPGSSATGAERAAFPRLRRLLLLKFAANLAELGTAPADNPYLVLLGDVDPSTCRRSGDPRSHVRS